MPQTRDTEEVVELIDSIRNQAHSLRYVLVVARGIGAGDDSMCLAMQYLATSGLGWRHIAHPGFDVERILTSSCTVVCRLEAERIPIRVVEDDQRSTRTALP